MQHSRESRIKIEEGKRSFGFGGSSEPDYRIEDLFEIVINSIEAASLLTNELITIVDEKADIIKSEIKFGE